MKQQCVGERREACREPSDCVRRPYGFIERFDPQFTPNTTDLSGLRRAPPLSTAVSL